MKVLADFHHEELYESLRILFEDRLGWELYRPIGKEWFSEGFWKVYDHPATVEQYLGIQDLAQDTVDRIKAESNFRWMNELQIKTGEGEYAIKSATYKDVLYRAITLEAFKNTEFDLVISSMPVHAGPFGQLVNLYQPKAKHIFQVGNNWPAPGNVKNILTSSAVTNTEGKHSVFYHQEFNLELFSPDKTDANPQSVVNMQHLMHDRSLFNQLAALMHPNWLFCAMGAGNGGACAGPDIENIAQHHRNMGFLWHLKRGGEGYGYNMHHAAATGTPQIVKKSYYAGMTADALLVDGSTCIDLDRHSLPAAAEILRDAAKNYGEWSLNTYNRFIEVVDFDKELEQIKTFLENLQ